MAESDAAKATVERRYDALAKGADRMRDAAKWMVASFGAVATVVFAGLTVADIGDLEPDTPHFRLWIALAGGLAAVIGVVAALSRAMYLAGASTTSLEDLTREPKWREPALRKTKQEIVKDPALEPWAPAPGDEDKRIEDFLAAYKKAYSEYLQWSKAYADDPSPRPDAAMLGKAAHHLKVMQGVAGRLLQTVGHLRLKASFMRSRFVIAGWLLLAAIGAMAFGWAANRPADDELNLAERPVTGAMAPDEHTTADLERQLSDQCVAALADPIPVVVLAHDDEGDEETLDVVTVPGDDCPPARLTVPAADVTQP
jgi:hypothetical protein